MLCLGQPLFFIDSLSNDSAIKPFMPLPLPKCHVSSIVQKYGLCRDDLVGLIVEALDNSSFSGVYNATAPSPVRMSELCASLGSALGRPSWLPVPDFAIQVSFSSCLCHALLAGSPLVHIGFMSCVQTQTAGGLNLGGKD